MTLRGRRVSVEALVVASAVVVLALLSFVRVSPPVTEALDTYASTDFRSGGYAAWATLLAREGISTAAFTQRPNDLDASIDTLIVAYPPGPVERTPAEAAALAAWVRAGGRAVVLGATPSLAPLERERLGRPAVVASGRGGNLRGSFAPQVAALARLGGGLGDARFVARHDDELIGDDGGAIAVRVALGAGEVIYVSGPDLFANRTIARAGNARLAYLLGRPRRSGGTVAFDEALHGTLVDRTWWGVLGIPDRIAFVGLVLAVVLALSGSALRLGPAIGLRPVREPTSAEFIEALTALYARTHARHHALAALAASIAPALRSEPAALALAAAAASPDAGDAQLLAGARAAYTLREARR